MRHWQLATTWLPGIGHFLKRAGILWESLADEQIDTTTYLEHWEWLRYQFATYEAATAVAVTALKSAIELAQLCLDAGEEKEK